MGGVREGADGRDKNSLSYTMVLNNQESRRKFWAIHLSPGSFAYSALLAPLHSFIRSFTLCLAPEFVGKNFLSIIWTRRFYSVSTHCAMGGTKTVWARIDRQWEQIWQLLLSTKSMIDDSSVFPSMSSNEKTLFRHGSNSGGFSFQFIKKNKMNRLFCFRPSDPSSVVRLTYRYFKWLNGLFMIV